tara:strand:+ start:885 stop:2666 length:1782 start_codon:yes stop_codon:yes gene_type:complete
VNIFNNFRDLLSQSIKDLQEKGQLPSNLDIANISVEPPRNRDHGDVSTNAALVLAPSLKISPREVAQVLAGALSGPPELESIEVAGPGFLNVRYSQGFWRNVLQHIVELGPEFGRSGIGKNRKVVLEYVSANPTGPLHVGHARGAIFGDALARLLVFSGFSVEREYYWNDAGAQVDKLARATYWRYLQSLGLGGSPSLPDGEGSVDYKGEYLVPVGQGLANLHNSKYVKMMEDEWVEDIRQFSVDAMKTLIRDDLKLLGVEFDNEISEREILVNGQVDEVVARLDRRDLIYRGQLEAPKGNSETWEQREQMLFRASNFGDEVDRPLQKSDGSWTYFATDIAYHLNKYNRGFKEMINVWGADHGGYVARVQAAVEALTDGVGCVNVALCQMVRLFDQGEPVKMSKRSGNFVTVRDLIDAMDKRVGEGHGKDVIRFIMLTRKNDAPLDFDFSRVSEQSRDNPVFYVQYAHARICSVLRRAQEIKIEMEPMHLHDREYVFKGAELELLRTLADWPRIVELASASREPHRVVFYLNELAAEFHSLWNKGNISSDARFIVEEDQEATNARLTLLGGVRAVLVSGLQGIIGVAPQAEMR